jgi:hypothetical protein
LPPREALDAPLRLLMARNETESLYLTLTNTSATASVALTVADIELRHNGQPAAQLEARLLVGGALPARPPTRRLTAEQRLRLMRDGRMPGEEEPGDEADNAVQILPFFDQGQMLGANMMRRYLTNGACIADYPSLTLPPGGAAVFMLRVTTDQAPPGRYEGVIAAVTARGDRLPLQFTLDVAPITLPEIDLWIRTWSNGTDQFPFESETRRRDDVRVKRELGASVWSGLPAPGGKAELFGFTGNTFYHVMGVPSHYIHAGYGNRIQVEDLTAEDEEKIVNHVRELVRRAGHLGLDYDDWFVELWDEPQESNAALYGALARIIRATDPRVRIYMNPLFWRPGHAPPEVIVEHLSPYYNDLIDVSVPISTLVGDNPTTRQLWTQPRFVRAFFLHPPGRAGRQMAWWAFTHDFNGWGYYCYYQPRGNPWDIRTWWELSYTYQMVFPGPHGAIITPLYETMREGWEDYRLLSALRQHGREDRVEELLRDFRQGAPLPELRTRALQAFD